jgi:hypothetical protein
MFAGLRVLLEDLDSIRDVLDYGLLFDLAGVGLVPLPLGLDFPVFRH